MRALIVLAYNFTTYYVTVASDAQIAVNVAGAILCGCVYLFIAARYICGSSRGGNKGRFDGLPIRVVQYLLFAYSHGT